MAVRNNPKLKDMVDDFFDGHGNMNDLLKTIISSRGVQDSERLKDRYIQRCRRFIGKVPQTPFTGALNEIVSWL
jgi:hypothetical protein